MPLTDSMLSIDWPAASSDGAYKTGSTAPWIQCLSTDGSYDDDSSFVHRISLRPVEDDDDGYDLVLSWRRPLAATPLRAVLRFFGHAMLERIPEDGLREAVESLAGIHEFYGTPIDSAKSPSLPPSSVMAKVRGSAVRPVFPAMEDD